MENQGAELTQHLARVLEDIVARVAPEVVAAGVCLPLPTAILLPRVPRAMVGVAVELNGQPQPGPAAVHAATARWAIGDRQ